MIPLLTGEEARAIDEDAARRLGLSTLVLMENAGAGAARLVGERFATNHVVIVCGPGQNGGDGFVVARHLANAGVRARCVLIGDASKVKGDAANNLRAWRASGGEVTSELRLDGASLVIDALFGTGLTRNVEGEHAKAIAAMNEADAPRLALDLPSGIHAGTGAVLGSAVRADVTATFAAHKRGLHQYPGAMYAGEVALVSIGVPFPERALAMLFEPDDVARLVPPRAADAHKGSAGHVLVAGGSPGRTGASILAARAALRAGAGLVTIAAREPARSVIDAKVLELMVEALPDDDTASALLAQAAKRDALVLGPGLGLDETTRAMAMRVAIECEVPCVLDADALTAFSANLSALANAKGPRVLTPHPGEAARLLGRETSAVQADRYASAEELASRAKHVVILKGARSIIATPSGEMFVVRRGTPALAVAGTGDVLAGTVAALLTTLGPREAACVAVVLHAVAGERAAHADRGLIAREVADSLPDSLQWCRNAAFSPR